MPTSEPIRPDDQTEGWPAGGSLILTDNPPRPVTCCAEHAAVKKGDVITLEGGKKVTVKGWDQQTGRIWIRRMDGWNSGWMPDHWDGEAPGCTSPDDPTCNCGLAANQFHEDPDTGFWVHKLCGKPTSLWLQGHTARMGGSW